MKRRSRRWYTSLWPAFFCAAVLELFVFAFVDPGDAAPLATMTLAFFFFWAAVAAAIFTSRWLERAPR
jgi:uncharacterized membrane protein HdeD (DUF308 family)